MAAPSLFTVAVTRAGVELSTVPMVATAVLLAFSATLVGAAVWERYGRPHLLSFSELMLWTWARRVLAERRLRQDAQKLVDAVGSTGDELSAREQLKLLQALSEALERKDGYTRGHVRRVERHSFKTGMVLDLPMQDVERIRKAASLHDVGKIEVPDEILRKSGRLTNAERAAMERHPVVGARMVAALRDPELVATVRHHHERWDGGGYPDRLRGEEIPLGARIVAVADTFDAMTSTRSYRAARSWDQAVKTIEDEAGAQFDPAVVNAFIASLPARPVLLFGMIAFLQPQALVRRIVEWLRGFGAGSLAPAVGAASTVAMLSVASLGAPPPAAGSVRQVERAETRRGEAVDGVLRKRVARSSSRPAKNAAPMRNRDREATRVSSKAPGRNRDQDARARRDRAEAGSSPAVASAASAPSSDATGDPAISEMTSEVQAAASGVSEGTVDPKAQWGKDCDLLGRASKGSRGHCR